MHPKSWHCQKGVGGLCPLPGFFWRICPRCTEETPKLSFITNSFVYSPLAAISHFLGHFGFSFKLSICYPKGLIRLPTIGCNYSLFGAFWIQFQIVNILHQGGSFDYPPFYAIIHFLGILDSVSNCQYATPRGLICLLTVGCN